MTPDKVNDPSRFVSQPGEMEMLTPEAILDRLDRMIADANKVVGEQRDLVAQCDKDIADFKRIEREALDKIAVLEKQIEDDRREFEAYGHKPE